MKRGKLYNARLGAIDRQQRYALDDALQLLKQLPTGKFDETVEAAFRLGVDPRQSDQIVRGALALPRGTGKTVRVIVIAEGEAAQAATAAGADEVGSDEILDRINDGWLDFDTLIATPDAMRKVRRLGRVLGPRGLMPNPKTGTVTDDTAAAVTAAKAGRVEYRADRGGCVHVPIGKLSFDLDALRENADAVVQALVRARPVAAKGNYMISMTVCSTMGPGIRVDTRSVVKA